MRRKKSRHRSNNKKFGNLWLITAVILVLFIAGLYYLKDHSHRRPEYHPDKEKTEKSESKFKGVSNQTESVAPANSQPQFDFYNMLSQPQHANNPNNNNNNSSGNSNSNNTIPAPMKSTNPLTSPTSSAKTNTKLQTQNQNATAKKPATITTTQYVLEIATLRDYNKVDEIKAELAINGFNVTTEKVKKGDAVEYRIKVGPYHSLKSAEDDQRRLRNNNMRSILVKAK